MLCLIIGVGLLCGGCRQNDDQTIAGVILMIAAFRHDCKENP